jgi:H/ACA ribonucleoprotein complex subunit 1
MADAKIDKSLDDIIKERKISARGTGRGGRGGPGGRGRGAPGGFRRGGAAGGQTSAAANRSFGRNRGNGMVQKRRSGGPGGSPLKGAAVCSDLII